jgi:hypothetical protein
VRPGRFVIANNDTIVRFSRVKAGSNTSTVALRVVGGKALGVINRPPFAWGIQIRGPGPPGWGSLQSETVKYSHESRGTLTPRITALARASSNCIR